VYLFHLPFYEAITYLAGSRLSLFACFSVVTTMLYMLFLCVEAVSAFFDISRFYRYSTSDSLFPLFVRLSQLRVGGVTIITFLLLLTSPTYLFVICCCSLFYIFQGHLSVLVSLSELCICLSIVLALCCCVPAFLRISRWRLPVCKLFVCAYQICLLTISYSRH
jgi:hypothetical protein